MRAALPQLDGSLHIDGITTPVTVSRDAHGVPDIAAGSLDDLLFAQGFVTAQDRLWQMDATRRHAAGELSEILGASFIESDRIQRMLQVRAAADRALTTLTPDQLHQLDAYARGVNAFIAQNADHLPVEFHLLHYKPAPWTPRDSLLVSLEMFQYLTTGFPSKLRREALAAHLPANLLADLYPVGSWRDHPPTEPQPDLTAPQPEVLQVPLDRTQSKLARPKRAPQTATPEDILRLAHEFPGPLGVATCDSCRAGSNNWAVAKTRSASGAPLVSNDLHLALAAPDIWYEAALHALASASSPALDVTGFTLPGVPLVVVGRNQHVAWSFTNLGADVQDVHIEHLRGSGNSAEFERPDGSWSPVLHHTERIRVRFTTDVNIDVETTVTNIGATSVETPLIAPLLGSDHRTLSLLWTAYDPANISTSSLATNTASSGAALVASLANFGGPALNLLYADDAGNIGYHAVGRIPVRGPAVQHRRASLTVIPAGPAPPDEDSGEEHSDNAAPEADTTAPVPAPNTLTTASSFTIGSPLSPVPVDSIDATQAWSGYIPYEALPATVNPPDGVLATANARVTSDDYPYAIALNWAAPYRVERIHKLLAGRTQLTPADMLAVQNDVHSEFDLVVARRVAYALDHAAVPILTADAKRLRQAADILRGWNGDVTPDAVAPSIVSAVRATIWRALLVPQITAHETGKGFPLSPTQILPLYQWDEQTVALEALLQHTPKRWLPKDFSNWNDFLATVTSIALHDANAPADLATWHYGRVHFVDVEHALFSTSPVFDRLLGVTTGTGMRSIGGDDTTVKQTHLHFGPSERFTADLVSAQATFGNITTGESGNPSSPHYLDQFAAWLAGTTFTMPLHATSANHVLTLVP